METLLKLRRFLETPSQPAAPKPEVCEMCGAALAEEHSHVIDTEHRKLLCACRPCYLLFTNPAAARGKFRSVSDRYFRMPDEPLSALQWEGMQIPVGIVFLTRNSALGRMAAFYPSPAGATESSLPLDAWEEMVATHPVLATMDQDVEALLICRRRGQGGESWIVPVDACYELVGRIRRHWKGFEGGDEAWREIDAFFVALAERHREAHA